MIIAIIKRFLEWMTIKEKLHSKEHKPPLFKEGEIWWSYFGENIGTEIDLRPLKGGVVANAKYIISIVNVYIMSSSKL